MIHPRRTEKEQYIRSASIIIYTGSGRVEMFIKEAIAMLLTWVLLFVLALVAGIIISRFMHR